MKYKMIFLLSLVMLLWLRCESANADEYTWISLIKEFKVAVDECNSSENIPKISDCIKNFCAEKLNTILSSEEIPLVKGIYLVRLPKHIETDYISKEEDTISNQNNMSTTKNFNAWSHFTFERICEFLSTRVLQINVTELISNETVGIGRHRRHRNNMMVVMMFGVTALGTIMVPLGFQFLALLTGKALLLAKMALLLASINGLKKVATSGVHYGLYHVPEDLNYGYYDRGDYQHS